MGTGKFLGSQILTAYWQSYAALGSSHSRTHSCCRTRRQSTLGRASKLAGLQDWNTCHLTLTF